MGLVIDLAMAWISLFLTVVLIIIYFFRIGTKSVFRNNQMVARSNKLLRKHHKLLGMALVLAGLIHGLFSSQQVFSFNLGTLCWIASILLGLNWLLRNLLKKKGSWIVIHRWLTLVFVALLVWHILDVGGLTVPKRIFNLITQNKQQFKDELQENQAENELIRDQAEEIEDENEENQGENKKNQGENRENQGESEKIEAQNEKIADNIQEKQTQQQSIKDKEKQLPSKEKQVEPLPDGREKIQEQPNDLVVRKYADGIFTGEAVGYAPGLKVEVEIAADTIVRIEVIEHHERGTRFYGPAIAAIPPAIIAKQSTEVDAVSGSTYTSLGIINAVKDALNKAKK